MNPTACRQRLKLINELVKYCLLTTAPISAMGGPVFNQSGSVHWWFMLCGRSQTDQSVDTVTAADAIVSSLALQTPTVWHLVQVGRMNWNERKVMWKTKRTKYLSRDPSLPLSISQQINSCCPYFNSINIKFFIYYYSFSCLTLLQRTLTSYIRHSCVIKRYSLILKASFSFRCSN